MPGVWVRASPDGTMIYEAHRSVGSRLNGYAWVRLVLETSTPDQFNPGRKDIPRCVLQITEGDYCLTSGLTTEMVRQIPQKLKEMADEIEAWMKEYER